MEQAVHQQEASMANMVTISLLLSSPSYHPLHHIILQNRELERRVQEVKEQEWNKMAVLQEDKIQLEEELSKAQKQNANNHSNQQALTNKFQDEIRRLEVDKVVTEWLWLC